jgi:hypothetical protein
MRLGALVRQRKVDMPSLVEATVLALMPTPGAQATVRAHGPLAGSFGLLVLRLNPNLDLSRPQTVDVVGVRVDGAVRHRHLLECCEARWLMAA